MHGPHGWRTLRRSWGRFFQDDVRIGASNAEGADTSTKRRPVGGPLERLRIDIEWSIFQLDLWVGCFEMQARWNLAVLECLHGLDEARDACGHVKVSDIRLDRTDGTKRLFPTVFLSRKCI